MGTPRNHLPKLYPSGQKEMYISEKVCVSSSPFTHNPESRPVLLFKRIRLPEPSSPLDWKEGRTSNPKAGPNGLNRCSPGISCQKQHPSGPSAALLRPSIRHLGLAHLLEIATSIGGARKPVAAPTRCGH